MKLRTGFVSNSSSSSFILSVNEEAVDMDWEDFGTEVFQCEGGHNLLKSELVFTQKAIAILKNETGDTVPENNEGRIYILQDMCLNGKFEEGFSIPSAFCPICDYQIITDRDALLVALAETGRNLDEQKEYLRRRFKNYQELGDFIRGKIQ